jgi:hypothetical protein
LQALALVTPSRVDISVVETPSALINASNSTSRLVIMRKSMGRLLVDSIAIGIVAPLSVQLLCRKEFNPKFGKN